MVHQPLTSGPAPSISQDDVTIAVATDPLLSPDRGFALPDLTGRLRAKVGRRDRCAADWSLEALSEGGDSVVLGAIGIEFLLPHHADLPKGHARGNRINPTLRTLSGPP